MPDPKTKSSHGIVTHAATVALNPARVLTSHLRNRYREKYLGRYRRAALVFAFDAFLSGIAVALIGWNIYLAFAEPALAKRYGLVLAAPPLKTAVPLALEARVDVRDGREHPNVRLAWDLPPGTEILTATPALAQGAEAYLSDLKPGAQAVARIRVRLFAPPGNARIGFRIADDEGRLAGSETRPIVGSGLTLEPLIKPERIVAGSHIPFRLKNTTDLPLAKAAVRVAGETMGEGKGRVASFEMLEPFGERLIFIEPRIGTPLVVEAEAQGTVLTHDELAFRAPIRAFPVKQLSLSPSTAGTTTRMEITASGPAKILIYHPLLAGATGGVRVFETAAGHRTITLPTDPAGWTDTTEWLAVPFAIDGGEIVVGLMEKAPITTPFLASAAARYYALTGDQIGVGPLPPRVGETTKYWVNWKLGPTSSDLSDLVFRARLPSGVRFTGRSSLPDGGELSETGDEISWRIPFLPATTSDKTASFEITLTPTADMRGRVPRLLDATTATANENRSAVKLEAQTPTLSADLPGDEQGKGKGKIR